jgi:transposase-like protein
MLGPPVCLPCKIIYRHLHEEEWLELRKSRPDISRWICPKCGKDDSTDCVFTIKKELWKEIEGLGEEE